MSDYPTQDELERIEKWKYDDFHGLMSYVRDLWYHPDWGWLQQGELYRISTAGWSGNEELIAAIGRNFVWWSRFWVIERRGGHYIFANRSVTDRALREFIREHI